ncbi:hypothetical protein [Streptomyces sp. NPDC052012]|uniref:hypothetical protein n=1 Tax=Streptomyces sp. NPDC052012 TaxID=3155051 RepID=UPI00344BACBB
MTDTKKTIYTILCVAIIPLVVGLGVRSSTEVDGEITSYTYFSVPALLAGIIGIGCLIRLYSAARFTARATGSATDGSGVNDSRANASRPARNVVLLLALLAVVSVFQLVRGAGVVPSVTECTAEYSFDLCIPATD